jgi:hypothetical protein
MKKLSNEIFMTTRISTSLRRHSRKLKLIRAPRAQPLLGRSRTRVSCESLSIQAAIKGLIQVPSAVVSFEGEITNSSSFHTNFAF